MRSVAESLMAWGGVRAPWSRAAAGVNGRWARSLRARIHWEKAAVHVSQLIEYTFKENTNSNDDKDASIQTLTLAFSPADVAILGWRLSKLVDLIRHKELDTIQELPETLRGNGLHKEKPFVACIKVLPIEKKLPQPRLHTTCNPT